MIRCPSFISHITVANKDNACSAWLVSLTADSMGMLKTTSFIKTLRVKNSSQEEAIQKAIDSLFYEFHLRCRGRWIMVQIENKYGSDRKELFKAFNDKLEIKYGKGFTYSSEDAQNEIIRHTGIGEMPITMIDLDEDRLVEFGKEPDFKVNMGFYT